MRVVVILAAMLCAVSAHAAADSTSAAPPRAKAKAASAAKATAAKHAKPATGKAVTKNAATKASGKGAEKTLRDINIEGEVKLPEVLFITSRDVERPLDWLDTYARAESDAASGKSDAPAVVHVVPAQPAPTDSTPPASNVKEPEHE